MNRGHAGSSGLNDLRDPYYQAARRVAVHTFYPASGATLPAPWATGDESPTGEPTLNYFNNTFSYELSSDTTDEQQRLALYWGNQTAAKPGPNDGGLLMVATWSPSGAAGDANTTMYMGLVNTRGAMSSSITTGTQYCLVRVAGADLDLERMAYDGTTTTSPTDTGLDVVKNQAFAVLWDFSTLSATRVWVTAEYLGTATAWTDGGTVNLGAWGNAAVQPIFELDRNSAVVESLYPIRVVQFSP